MKLAVDLGLLSDSGGQYEVASPLGRFLTNPDQLVKAAVLRVLLESYKPFTAFRTRLTSAPTAAAAAQQVRAMLDLDAHREDIKETLLSLGTYSQALEAAGGGHYVVKTSPMADLLGKLATAAANAADAENAVRNMLGPAAEAVSDRDSVLLPLADALICAQGNDGRGAVVNAGNAVESYLVALGGRCGTALAGANGINAKLDRLDAAHVLPKKLIYVGKYLGHVRNAADHGIDNDIGAAWSIRTRTGLEYVNVACSFLSAARLRELQGAAEI